LSDENAGEEAKKMAPKLKKQAPPEPRPSAEPLPTEPKSLNSKATEPKTSPSKQLAEANSRGLMPDSAPGQKSLTFGVAQGRDEAPNNYVPLWAPQLVADEKGEVRVHFTLPERAANYRVFVDAHGNGRIGSATRALLVAPQAPQEKSPPATSDGQEEAAPK
jgi:hypothetical protein